MTHARRSLHPDRSLPDPLPFVCQEVSYPPHPPVFETGGPGCEGRLWQTSARLLPLVSPNRCEREPEQQSSTLQSAGGPFPPHLV